MPRLIKCSSCATGLQVPDGAAAVKCPKCNTVLRLPGAAPAPAPKPAATAPKPPPAAPKPAAPTKPAASPPKPAANKPAPPAPVPVKKPAPTAPSLKKTGPAASKPPAAPDKPTAALTAKPRAGSPADKKPAKPTKDQAEEAEVEPVEEDVQEKRGARVAAVRPGQDPFKGLGVPGEMKDSLREQLEEDEEIVWIGRPLPELMLRKAKIAWIVGFVMVALAAGSFALGFLFSETIPMIGPILFGVCLLLFCIPCFLVPTLVRRGIPSRPCYVITNQRVFVYFGSRMGIKAYNRRQLMTMMERRESRWVEGAGDLIFERTVSYEADTTSTGRSVARKRVEEQGFTDMANVRDVENLIRKTIILRTPTAAEAKADAAPAKKPAAESKTKKPAKPAAEEDNIKSVRRGGSWLTEDEAAELTDGDRAASEDKSGGGGRELIDDSELPDKLKARIHNHIYEDESVLWVGQPHQKIIFMRALFPAGFLLFFACVMGGMMLFSSSVPVNVPTILVSIGMLIGGLLFPVVQRLKAHHTGYMLTSKRCVVFEPNFIGQVKATAYMPDIVAKMRRQNAWSLKGGGDLIFRTVTTITTKHSRDRRTGAPRGSSTSVTQTHYGFLAIDNVDRVETLINKRLVEPYLDRVHGV